jgi:hypothetical protein
MRILFFHLRLSLPSGHFPSSSPIKILYAFLTSSMSATFPVQLPEVNHPVILGVE